MTPRPRSEVRHGIPDKIFFALASGGGGASAARLLQTAQYSKRLLLLRGVRDAALASGHAQADHARNGYASLAELQQRASSAVDTVVRHPATGAWAQDTYAAMLRGEDSHPGGLAALAASAAVRAAVPGEFEVPVRRDAVVLPSLGRARAPGRDTVVVRTTSTKTEVGEVRLPADPHADAPGWDAVRVLSAQHGGLRLRMLLDEVDPHRLPDADLTARRLSEEEMGEWRALLRRAWALLVERHRTVADEVAAMVTAVALMERDPHGKSVSATSPKAFGCVGMSAPADARSLAVTFAHEVQHIKLAALTELVSLTLPDDGRRFYAPWRDDPRPASGLLHGVYAHVGVAGFWRRQRVAERGEAALWAHTHFVRWRDAVALGARTLLTSGSLSAEGRTFVGELARTVNAWRHDPVPAEAAGLAREAAELHRAQWRRHNGPPPPGEDAL